MRTIPFLLLLAACHPFPDPVPPLPDADASSPPLEVVDAAPTPPQDASTALEGASTRDARHEASPGQLGAMCEALRFSGCPEGNDTPGHQSCEDVYGPVIAFPASRIQPLKVAACRDIACIRKNGFVCK